MTQAQYNIIDMKRVGESLVPVFSAMPNELKGSWIHVTKLNHSSIKYVSAIYFNDMHPENTVIVSDYLPTTYPDLYCTVNKNGRNERVYVNPKYRKTGLLGISGLVARAIFNDYLNVVMDVPLDRSAKTEKATKLVKDMWQETIKDVPLECGKS